MNIGLRNKATLTLDTSNRLAIKRPEAGLSHLLITIYILHFLGHNSDLHHMKMSSISYNPIPSSGTKTSLQLLQTIRNTQVQRHLGAWWIKFQTALSSPEQKEEALKTLPLQLFTELKNLSGIAPLNGTLVLDILEEHKQVTNKEPTFSTSISSDLRAMVSERGITALLELLVRLFSCCPSEKKNEELLIQVTTEILSERTERRLTELLDAARVTFLDILTSTEFKLKLITVCCLKIPAITGQESKLTAQLDKMPPSSARDCALVCIKLITGEDVSWTQLFLHAPGEAEVRLKILCYEFGTGRFAKFSEELKRQFLYQTQECLQGAIAEECLKKLSPELLCQLIDHFLKSAPKESFHCALLLGNRLTKEILSYSDEWIPVQAVTGMLDRVRTLSVQGLQKSWLDLGHRLLNFETNPSALRNVARFIWHYHLHLSPNRDAASACALSQITTSFQLHGIQNVEIRNFYVEANHFFVEEPEALVELKRLSHQLTLESDKQLRYQVAKSLITTTQLFIHSPIKGYSGKTVFEWIMQPWAHVIIGREEAKTLISDLLGLCCSHPKDAISSSLLPKMLQIFSQWDEESSQSVAKEYLEGLFTESAEIGYSLFPYRLTTYFIRKRLLSQKQLIELLLDPTTQHYPLSFGITAPLIDCFQMPYVSKIAFKVIENLVGAIDRSISNEVLMGLELLHDGQTYLPKTKSKEIQLWRRQLIKGRLPLQCFVNQSCSTSHSTENRQQLLGQHLYNLQDARITHQPLPAPLPESILEIDCSTTLEKALWMAIRREELSIHAYTASSVEEWAALAEEKQIGVEQPLHTILMASELLKKEVNRSCFITKESVQRWLDRLLELLDNQETNLHSEARWEWLAALATEMHKRQPYEVTSFLCLLEQYQKITRPNPVQLDHCIASLTHTQDSTPPIQHAIRLGVRRLAPNCYPMVST